MKSSHFFKAYLLYGICYLGILIFAENKEFSFFFKPFLMLPLFLAIFFQTNFPTKKMLLSAIFFSWVGDVTLIFSNVHQMYFIGGLLAFLTAHILYILIFQKEKNALPTTPLASFQWLGFGLIALFCVILLSLLLPNIKEIKIPVCIYACTICSMLAMALSAVKVWKSPANYWILGGAATFVISDSILAFNRFYPDIHISNPALWVMITYLAAQFLIVRGVVKLHQS